MESEQGRNCQASSAPGLRSQSSSLVYSQESGAVGQQGPAEEPSRGQQGRGQFCPAAPQDTSCGVGAWGLPEFPQGQGLDLGLVDGIFRPWKN